MTVQKFPSDAMTTLETEVGDIANNVREFADANGWNLEEFTKDIESEVRATEATGWTRERRYIAARIITSAPVCKTTPQNLCQRIANNIRDNEELVEAINE